MRRSGTFRPRTNPGTEAADETEGPGGQDDRPKAQTPRFERRPQLMALSTDGDRPLDWLRARQALQHALLTATHYGVSASFLTQPLELHDARSRQGGPRQSPESPEPEAGAQLLKFPGRNPRLPKAADNRSQPLPGPGRDSASAAAAPGRRHSLSFPRMVLRVGYATHDASPRLAATPTSSTAAPAARCSAPAPTSRPHNSDRPDHSPPAFMP